MPSLFLATWGRQHLKIWGASSSAWAPTSPWYHLLTASFRLLTTPFPIPNMWGGCHGVPFHQDIEGHVPWGPISPRYRGLRPLPPRTNPIGSFGADASCPPDGGMAGASLGNSDGSFSWVSRLAPFLGSLVLQLYHLTHRLLPSMRTGTLSRIRPLSFQSWRH